MTSRRKRKKTAASLGLSERELLFAELLDEVLEHVRWLAILGYGNQFLLRQHADVDDAERDRVLEAATRAVEKDGRIHEWRQRLARLKSEAARLDAGMDEASRPATSGDPNAD